MLPAMVKQDAAGAGCSLVYGCNVFGHIGSLSDTLILLDVLQV